jgi:hypothetical protein
LSAVAGAAALTLLGCGKKEEAPKAEAPAAKVEPLNLATKSSPALSKKCLKAPTPSASFATWPVRATS